ncbi:MAG: uracil-DNA glycosylase [Chloroflexota bacterium]
MADDRVRLLEETRSQALTCQRCDLWRTRTRVVFGEGNPFARLMLVGEGPGATEDKLGRPFVGRAGQLLDRALAEAGLRREELWLTNLVRSRPVRIAPNGAYGNRAPQAGEVAACLVWRQAEFELVAPKVIVCLGAVPASYLIHKNFRLNAERSEAFEVEGTQRLATFHPAYIIRQVGAPYDTAFQALVEDLRLAAGLALEG